MPSKGKRVASRQNNLRRRRGGTNRPAPARNSAAASPVAAAVAEAEPDQPAPATTAAAPVQSQSRSATAIGRSASTSRGRRFDRPAAYNYVSSELRRIGIFSGVLVVVLVAASFVL